jgi:class 3 adenylate cyclase
LGDGRRAPLGVTALGHRRKLLDAIAALRNDASLLPPAITASPTRPSATTPTAAPVAEAMGERRHLTVMFCDLVGSTSISARLDAEDWRDLVGSYLDAASAAVTEMGGHVAKKLGDGLMGLFGYPAAQETDAERAARAALSIQRSLAEINRKNEGSGKPALNARIGIETGPVVVDASGEIYGDAPNTAARVQALAEPGTVIVTAQVQRQIAGLFVAEERGTHDLKGVPEPVMLFRLVRASGGGRRAGQRHLTPLVGPSEAWQPGKQSDYRRRATRSDRGARTSGVTVDRPCNPASVTPSQLRFFGGVIVQPARIKAVMMIRASLVKSTGPSIFIGGSKSTAGIVTSFIDCRYFNVSGGKLATSLRVSSSIFLSSIPFTPCCEWAENRA